MLENKKRFDDEFGIEEEDDIIDRKKPIDFQETFKGNIDDCFRVGLRFVIHFHCTQTRLIVFIHSCNAIDTYSHILLGSLTFINYINMLYIDLRERI